MNHHQIACKNLLANSGFLINPKEFITKKNSIITIIISVNLYLAFSLKLKNFWNNIVRTK